VWTEWCEDINARRVDEGATPYLLGTGVQARFVDRHDIEQWRRASEEKCMKTHWADKLFKRYPEVEFVKMVEEQERQRQRRAEHQQQLSLLEQQLRAVEIEKEQMEASLAKLRTEMAAQKSAHDQNMAAIYQQYDKSGQEWASHYKKQLNVELAAERHRVLQTASEHVQMQLAQVMLGQRRNDYERKQREKELQERADALCMQHQANQQEHQANKQEHQKIVAALEREQEDFQRQTEKAQDAERKQRVELEKELEKKKKLEESYKAELIAVQEEKRKEGEDHDEQLTESYVRMRPLQDAVSYIDEILFKSTSDATAEEMGTKQLLEQGYYANILRERHLIKTIGDLDVEYMIKELGLPEEAMMEAFYWSAMILSVGKAEEVLPTPPEDCPTYDNAMVTNQITGKLERIHLAVPTALRSNPAAHNPLLVPLCLQASSR
jgi:hypothetical protein